MRRRRLALMAMMAAAMLGAGLLGQTARADQPPLLSADEVNKLVNSGQYADALKALFRILELKGPAAAAYDRGDMLLLRAECQLQTKQKDAAIGTLVLVQREALAAGDVAHAAQAEALSMLLKKSPGFMYTPRTGKMRKPIPVLDRILRKAAYDALYADELAPLEAKARAAKTATSLAPIVEAAKMLPAVRPLERVSTGGIKRTSEITDDLSNQSLKLFNDALTTMSATTQRISDAANRVVTKDVLMSDARGRSYTQTQSYRQGLGPNDAQTLMGIEKECGQIPEAAADVAKALAADPAPFKDIAAKAALLKDKAKTVRTDDYIDLVH